MRTRLLGAVAVAAVVVFALAWAHGLQSWLAVHTGTDNEPGPYYGFFSGFGSDLGEVTLIAALLSVYRRHNCEVHGCWRLGRHETAAGHHVCRVHHPDGHLTAAKVEEQHDAAQAGTPPAASDVKFDRLADQIGDLAGAVRAAVAPVKAGAGSDPATSEGLPADAVPVAERVVPPAAAPKRKRM